MITKYICRRHNLVTTRKGMRKHIAAEHARNKFKALEFTDLNANGVWQREEFNDK